MKRNNLYRPIGLLFLFLIFNVHSVSAKSISKIAENSAKELGVVIQAVNGKAGEIILFEENHASLNGQIEIAHMLVRLYKNSGLRNIGLEGSTSSGSLKTTWANSMSKGDRLNVSARLLGDGELSSAEFMASAFDDISVVGIDDQKAYNIGYDEKASSSLPLYLLLIAEQSLTPSQAEEVSGIRGQV